ncbi:dihydrolipoyl dehydrogenase [Candidatus Rariloculus sp.]|uniref:dihydrolipoyl dehydrogenase n=1 Tax=Candidatus Rariloculus sp. TaxID=3101265 RepID=UPI003D124FCF
MSEQQFDVVVIGGGPAGYPAAIRAAQLGLSVACVDDWKNSDGTRQFGGTCLNVGCIPSKALLESSELYHRAETEFGTHGIEIGGLTLDLAAMQGRKQRIVKQLTTGIEALFESAGVTAIKARGRLLGDRRVEVTSDDGSQQVLGAEHVVLATGSTPIELPVMPFDGQRIVDSADALEFSEVPGRLGVIGAGVIGLELGSVWRRLGAEVVLLEALDTFLPIVDEQVARDALKQFKRQGFDIRLGARVTGADVDGEIVTVSYDAAGAAQQVEVDKLIVCVGRRPVTDGLLAPEASVELDDQGFIAVDQSCRTSAPKVWAVGDVVRGPMLAHKGTEEGVMAAELIAGHAAEVNYSTIPSVIYTAPEIAWVGKTEAEVKASGRAYNVGTFPFGANGRAKALQQVAGMVKLIADREYDEILGMHIVGPMAGELIAEAVLAMEFSASAEDLQRTIHAHPTLTEAVHEAALSVDKRAIHALNR